MGSRAQQQSRQMLPAHKRNISLDVYSDIWETKSTTSSATGITRAISATASSQKPYANSHTWRSNTTRIQNDFDRMVRLVRHIAPEQFRNPARPTSGPCNIVPTTLAEYIEHTKDVLQLKTKEMQRNIALKELARDRQAKIKANGEAKMVQPNVVRFGAEAALYTDGRSPVLCQPTMWYADVEEIGFAEARWPTQSELQACADNKKRDQVFTRCGRYLPAPRIRMIINTTASVPDMAEATLSYIKVLLPFDEHGPIYREGPAALDVLRGNADTDTDPGFEQLGREWLGEDLMQHMEQWIVD